MPRAKNSRRGSNKRGFSGHSGRKSKPRNKAGGSHPTYDVDLDALFTMKDEAKHTAHTNRIWDRDAKLRNRPVVFVSAGIIQPIKLLEDESDEQRARGESHVGGSPNKIEDTQPPPARVYQNQNMIEHIAAVVPPTIGSSSPMVDTIVKSFGKKEEDSYQRLGESLWTISVTPPRRASNAGITQDAAPEYKLPSNKSFSKYRVASTAGTQKTATTDSARDTDDETDSSGEVIVFRGRNKKQEWSNRAPERVGRSPGELQEELPIDFQESCGRKQYREHEKRARERQAKVKEEQALIDDYLANIDFDSNEDESDEENIGAACPSFSKRDLGHELAESQDQSSCPEPSDEEAMDPGFETGEQNSDEPFEMDDESFAWHIYEHDFLRRDRSQKRPGPKKFIQRRGDFPSASSLADALEDLAFDSDFAIAPSKGKGKKKYPPVFGVYDPDLEAALSMAWQNDRIAKKEKKVHREKLRVQGRLGNCNPDDPRVKYPFGIRITEIKEELRLFLINSDERLAFPPMDQHGRKTLHTLANKLRLKSKSTGIGDSRATVVYRTKATPSYDPYTFDKLITARGRPFFHRPDVEGATKKLFDERTIRNRLKFKDGEIVHSSIPQLGQDNKGWSILKKMGWNHGTALGSENNKGILEPVVHVMKTTKAGLGTNT